MDPLNPTQARVLGCLLEKSLATPQQYPLSEAALITACNQATNRFPVVEYDLTDLRPALIGLRDRSLAKRTRRPGERVEKHAHLVDQTLGLDAGAMALVALLLLRGPQTAGELRSRATRMSRFSEVSEVEAVLRRLAEQGLAEQLERRPGEKQVRWRHLLSGREAPVEIAPDAPPPAASVGGSSVPTVREVHDQLEALSARVATLEGLAERVARLERELGLTQPPAEEA